MLRVARAQPCQLSALQTFEHFHHQNQRHKQPHVHHRERKPRQFSHDKNKYDFLFALEERIAPSQNCFNLILTSNSMSAQPRLSINFCQAVTEVVGGKIIQL